MEWIERFNRAINYIEENLTGEIDMDEIAKLAYCSRYHFQRMFSYMAEIPLAEYIRKRKMSRAAIDLLDNNKVIDVAIKYGYDSPTAFTRAFKSVHGIAPSEVKRDCANLKAFSPVSFKMIVKGDYEMEYHVERKEAFRIVGISVPLAYELEANIERLQKQWTKVAVDGTIARLVTLMDGGIQGLMGVSSCNQKTDWRYYIAVASEQPLEGALEEYVVPEATWAIFSGVGTQIAITELERRILMEWLPTSGYEYADAPDIELYIDPDPSTGRYEVWIPVVRKSME